jgi:hypothetical protein
VIATELLATLRLRGLTVMADGNALIVRPRDLLTDELRAAIRAHKRDLLAELPRYRWLIVERDGRRREICVLPEMSAAQLEPCYPGARLVPLSDSAAEAGEQLRRVEYSG